MGNVVSIIKKLLCLEPRQPIDLLLDDFEKRHTQTEKHPLVVEHVDFEDRRNFKYVPRYVYRRKNIKYYSDGKMYVDDSLRVDTGKDYNTSEIR